MNILVWLISKITQLFFGGGNNSRSHLNSANSEARDVGTRSIRAPRNFDDDYRAATGILKARIDRSFPDNYYVKPKSESEIPYDHGEIRAAAIDTTSKAIAAALRKGDSIQQAAAAGAASVGI